MPAYCSAFGCKSSGGRDNVIFHHFPRQKKLAAQWAAAVRRKHFRPSKSTVLCSNHFRDSDYYHNISLMRSLGLSIKNVRLKPGTVPSIFAHNRKRSPSPTAAIAERQKREIVEEPLGYEVTSETARAPKPTSRTKSGVPAGTSLLEQQCTAPVPPGTSLLRRSHLHKGSLPVVRTDGPVPSTPAVACHGNAADPTRRNKASKTRHPVSADKFVQVRMRLPVHSVALQVNVRTKKVSHSTQTFRGVSVRAAS